MANPQLENGYLKIVNELMDALIAIRIPGEARQVFDLILRKTYGFNKKSDAISLSQFSKATGLKKPRVVQCINKLMDLNLIIKKDHGHGVSYGILKDYDRWKPLSKKITKYRPKPKLIQKCYLCNYDRTLHVHHITPRSKGGSNSYKNKVNLCPNCHSLVHKGEYTEDELLSKKIMVESIAKNDNRALEKVKKPLSKTVPTKDNTKDTIQKTELIKEIENLDIDELENAALIETPPVEID